EAARGREAQHGDEVEGALLDGHEVAGGTRRQLALEGRPGRRPRRRSGRELETGLGPAGVQPQRRPVPEGQHGGALVGERPRQALGRQPLGEARQRLREKEALHASRLTAQFSRRSWPPRACRASSTNWVSGRYHSEDGSVCSRAALACVSTRAAWSSPIWA